MKCFGCKSLKHSWSLHGSKGNRFGFSLVELLVVLGIVAIMISVLMPSLAVVREQARRRVCQSEMHQLSVMIVAYGSAYGGQFPFPLESTGEGDFRYPRSGLIVPPVGAVSAGRYWPSSMFDEFGRSMYSDILLCPDDSFSLQARAEMAAKAGVSEDEVQGPAIRGLSMSLYIDPAALSRPRANWEDWFLHINGFADVIFPSQKALLVEIEPFHEPGYYVTKPISDFHLMVSAMDGSAVWRGSTDATPAVPLGMAQDYGLNPAAVDWRLSPFQLCRDGVHGRDW